MRELATSSARFLKKQLRLIEIKVLKPVPNHEQKMSMSTWSKMFERKPIFFHSPLNLRVSPESRT